jgi:hypothetical protein
MKIYLPIYIGDNNIVIIIKTYENNKAAYILSLALKISH